MHLLNAHCGIVALLGLKNSKCFVALISRKALDRVRDKGSDHTYDNVLLEYETALNVSPWRFIYFEVVSYHHFVSLIDYECDEQSKIYLSLTCWRMQRG
jgi:hypothetical protein